MKIPLIISQSRFEDKIIPNLKEDCFYISILDPDDLGSLSPDTDNFKTFKFWDIEEDISSYKCFNFEQAREMYQFIKANYGKQLIVHCHAGVSRSSAVGEFYFEMQGGSYKQLTEVYKNIMPNGRVLSYLRIAEKEDTTVYDFKINFTDDRIR